MACQLSEDKSKPKNTNGVVPDVAVWALLWARAHLLVLSILLIAINRGAGLVWPYLSKYLVDDIITRSSKSLLILLVSGGLLSTLIQGASGYLINRTVNLSALRVVADLRKRLHYHALRLSVAYYDGARTGDLVSRLMSDADAPRSVLGGGFVSFLGAILTACIAFVVLLRINAALTLIVFSVLSLFGLLLRRALHKNRPLFREANAIRAEIAGRLTESLAGVRVVKAYGAEPSEHQVFTTGVDRHLERVITATTHQGLLDLTVVVMIGLASAAVTYFGGIAIMSATMTLGDFFRFTIFMGVLAQPLVQAVSVGTQFNEAVAGLERVKQLLIEPREDQDTDRSILMGEIRGRVCFDSVGFAYGDDPPVLHEISFQAEPGIVTALVGASGAGKSTIIGLLAGFYKASNGTIWVDGLDLSRVNLASYRAQLGVVPQDPFLFSGTIRDNVALGCPSATHEEILGACRLAHVDEFAARFPETYETIVGERGVKLSIGQRQRIAIARALLADPRILILDEATSSLDSVSEALIQEALSLLMRDRTTFVIAHRLSTIRQAHQILVVDSGRIVESGTHGSLFQAKGRYWQLYTTQYGLQSNLFLGPGEGDRLSAASTTEFCIGLDAVE